MGDKCEAKVWHGWARFPCTRNAKRRVGTGNYCEQHARIAERRKKYAESWKHEIGADRS